MPSHLNPIPEHLSTIILNAVQEHEKQIGVGSLALVLKGSKSKILQNRKLYLSKFYGALFYYPLDALENCIAQLQQQKFIATTLVTGNPYPFPALQLSADGERVLKNKIDIPLKIQRTYLEVVFNESLQETLRLFLEKRDISLVATQRGLALSTIWKHLVDLIRLEKIKSGDVVNAEKIILILEARRKLPKSSLTEMKESLPADISYEEIKCVLAEERVNTFNKSHVV